MGLIGFLATAIPVIWLGLGGVEMVHWMQLRQTLSLILMDAARAGATRHANPETLARVFEQGLHRAYPAPGEAGRILHRRQRDLGVPWHMSVQLPSPAAFADHADPTLAASRRGQLPMIRNDHQAAQHAARLAQGWPQGRGPQSGLTIHEANTLRIALQWPHQPLFPGAAALMKALAPLSSDARNRTWMAQGYLPFRRTVAIAMHSHPAAWPDLPDGRVTHEALRMPDPASGGGTNPSTAPGGSGAGQAPVANGPPSSGAGPSGGNGNDGSDGATTAGGSSGGDGTPPPFEEGGPPGQGPGQAPAREGGSDTPDMAECG